MLSDLAKGFSGTEEGKSSVCSFIGSIIGGMYDGAIWDTVSGLVVYADHVRKKPLETLAATLKGAVRIDKLLKNELDAFLDEMVQGSAEDRGHYIGKAGVFAAMLCYGAAEAGAQGSVKLESEEVMEKIGREGLGSSKEGLEGAEGSEIVVESGSKTISTIGDLSQEQIDALIKYTGDDYANINSSLRGLETATPENQATINAMKSALDNASLPEDMVLYRGTSTEALGNLKNLSPEELVGKTFTEPGFMSTSTNGAVASGTFSGNLQITIEAASGGHALDISSISQYSNEAEILFNAGQEMRIISAESKNGILHIIVLAK